MTQTTTASTTSTASPWSTALRVLCTLVVIAGGLLFPGLGLMLALALWATAFRHDRRTGVALTATGAAVLALTLVVRFVLLQ